MNIHQAGAGIVMTFTAKHTQGCLGETLRLIWPDKSRDPSGGAGEHGGDEGRLA